MTIAYRKRLVDSPAYRLNHEEVVKALEEGIVFAENLNPIEARAGSPWRGRGDGVQAGGAGGGKGRRAGGRWVVTLPARTVLVAAGTTPNIDLREGVPGTFQLDAKKKFFQPHAATPAENGRVHLTPDPGGFFTSYDFNGKLVTYYGDNHPRYAGNVVKAMASAKHGFPHIVRLFARELAALDSGQQAARDSAWARLVERLDADLDGRVEEVVRLTPTIVEVIVKAPAAARHFQPGPVLSAAELRVGCASSARQRAQRPATDGRYRADRCVGRQGARAAVADCARARRVQPARVRICRRANRWWSWVRPARRRRSPNGRNVLLLGGGLGNAVLFSIAKAMREHGNRVIYFAGYKQGRRSVQARRDRNGAPTRSSGAPTSDRDDCAGAPAGRATFAATSCRR